jgi:hypothetical protein
VSGSTIADNSAGDGGAIDNGDHNGSKTTSGAGTATATSTDTDTQTAWDSTFTGNSASDDGGATDNGDHGGSATAADTQTVWDSTFSGDTGGRGAVSDNGDNAGSGAVYEAADIFDGGCLQGTGAGSSWVDGGYNAGSDASCENGGTGDSTALTSTELGPLANNGGPTQTVWPLAGNPALGIVPSSTSLTLNGNSVELCPLADQRGVAGAAGTCNAGAVQNGAPLFTSTNHLSVVIKKSFRLAVTAGGDPAPTITRSGTLPKGVRFSGGVLSGTPASGTGGTYHLTFSATSHYGVSHQRFTLTVTPALAVPSAN